jgi:hypothetical protein
LFAYSERRSGIVPPALGINLYREGGQCFTIQ